MHVFLIVMSKRMRICVRPTLVSFYPCTFHLKGSVWSALPPINSSLNTKPIILVITSMDSASFFRDKNLGAESPISVSYPGHVILSYFYLDKAFFLLYICCFHFPGVNCTACCCGCSCKC